MALSINKKIKFKKVWWRTGRFYTFQYRAWEHDPEPVIILMYFFSGRHPNTGRQWRFMQGVNISYIPRANRKAFVSDWKRAWERSNGNFEFTYRLLSRRYPWMKTAIRRYFYSPANYITPPLGNNGMYEVPFDAVDDIVVSTFRKDFSKKIKRALANKLRTAMEKRGGFLSRAFGLQGKRGALRPERGGRR
jgi:hypothetical protein